MVFYSVDQVFDETSETEYDEKRSFRQFSTHKSV